MRRLVALLAAVAMVVVAIVVRSAIEGGGSAASGRAGRLLCASELAAACARLAHDTGIRVDIASAGDTVRTLSTLPDDQLRSFTYDGWLTPARDAEVVRDTRARAQLASVIGAPTSPIARSPLLLTVWKDRAAVLAAHCGGAITWKCLGDVAGTAWASIGGSAAWGDVKPGHADPSSTAEGLAVIGQAAAQFFGRDSLSLDDFDADAFVEWFSRLERAVPSGAGVGDASAFEHMLAAGPASFDVVASTEAEVAPLLAAAAPDRRAAMTLLYPAPVASEDVVFAPVAGRGGALRDLVTGDDGRRALAGAGFRVDGEPRARGVPSRPDLPARSNLPDAGALEALLQTWREVTA